MLIRDDSYKSRYLWKRTPKHKTVMGSFDMFECDDHLEIWSFGIKERHQGKGYGQQMLKEAIKLANGRKLTLYVQKCNTTAIHVYEKCGFKISGLYPRGDYAWEMTYVGENDAPIVFNEHVVASKACEPVICYI